MRCTDNATSKQPGSSAISRDDAAVDALRCLMHRPLLSEGEARAWRAANMRMRRKSEEIADLGRLPRLSSTPAY
jgi:hypothetical protein